MKVTSEQLSQCAEKIASYGFTDRVDGHSIQSLIAHAANELSKERLIVKSLTKKLEELTKPTVGYFGEIPLVSHEVTNRLAKLGFHAKYESDCKLEKRTIKFTVKERNGKVRLFRFNPEITSASIAVEEILKGFSSEG